MIAEVEISNFTSSYVLVKTNDFPQHPSQNIQENSSIWSSNPVNSQGDGRKENKRNGLRDLLMAYHKLETLYQWISKVPLDKDMLLHHLVWYDPILKCIYSF